MTSSSVQAIIQALNQAGVRQAYGRRVSMAVAPDVEATFVGLKDLLRMKKTAGRPQDLLDIEQLKDLSGERGDD